MVNEPINNLLLYFYCQLRKKNLGGCCRLSTRSKLKGSFLNGALVVSNSPLKEERLSCQSGGQPQAHPIVITIIKIHLREPEGSDLYLTREKHFYQVSKKGNLQPLWM